MLLFQSHSQAGAEPSANLQDFYSNGNPKTSPSERYNACSLSAAVAMREPRQLAGKTAPRFRQEFFPNILGRLPSHLTPQRRPWRCAFRRRLSRIRFTGDCVHAFSTSLSNLPAAASRFIGRSHSSSAEWFYALHQFQAFFKGQILNRLLDIVHVTPVT